MKKILIILICFHFQLTNGQIATQKLESKVWKVREIYSERFNKKLLTYHEDSLNNLLDYSKVEYYFKRNNQLAIYSTDNPSKITERKWWTNNVEDTLFIDSIPCIITELTSEKLIYRQPRYYISDTSGTIATGYDYTVVRKEREVVTALDEYQKSVVNIYPNPIKEDKVISIDVVDIQLIKSLSIYNSSGQLEKTLSLNSNKNKVNVDFLKPGIYSLEVKYYEKSSSVLKFVIY